MKTFNLILTGIIFLCLANTAFATITLTATIVNNKCYNGTAGSITGSATGGSGSYEYRLATGAAAGWQTGNSFTALTASTYSLSARDKNNTTDIATIYVTVTQPTALTVAGTVTNTSCSASTDGAVSLIVSGGTPAYAYSWTKNGTTITGATASSIIGLAPGVYNALVTDANGCTQQLTTASSTAIVPLALTGFNVDAIANGTNTTTSNGTPNSTVSSPVDVVNTDNGSITFPGTNFYINGFKTNSSSTAFADGGLPTTGSITSDKDATHKFVLTNPTAATTTAFNDLRLNGSSASGTLTISSGSAAAYQNLFLLATSGNGVSTVNYTVTYSDATTATGSISIPDWNVASSVPSTSAISSLQRVYYEGYSYTSNRQTVNVPVATQDPAGAVFAMFDLPISITSNTKNIASVTFANTTASQANIFAITGSISATGLSVAAGASASVTPAVAIATNPSSLTYCSGESFILTATPTNAGNSPTYVWSLPSGVTSSTGTTGPSITVTATGTGSKSISVALTVTDGNATCLTSTSATKNITLTSGSVTPSVTISGPTSACQGSATTYIATPTNGGNSPTYAWYVNSVLDNSQTGATYSPTLGTGTNSVYAKLTSSTSCASPNPATSTNTISTVVNANVTPSVTIKGSATTSNNVTTVVFSITSSSNLGSSPTYQWNLNGNPISGATSSTYSVASPSSSDLYSLTVASSATCPTSPYISSNYVSVNAVLPITLDMFKASLQNSNNVLLSWHSATEVNAKRFDIEKSAGSTGNFAIIGSVKALNNIYGSTYSYLDTLTVNGSYFYRLKSIDLDGSYTYSDIASISYNKGAATALMVYPNPFSNELNLQITASQNIPNASFTLYNIAGQKIYTTIKNIIIGSQLINLQDVNNIPSGVYILKLNGAGMENSGIKIIKK